LECFEPCDYHLSYPNSKIPRIGSFKYLAAPSIFPAAAVLGLFGGFWGDGDDPDSVVIEASLAIELKYLTPVASLSLG
jgi:hypothetical protein